MAAAASGSEKLTPVVSIAVAAGMDWIMATTPYTLDAPVMPPRLALGSSLAHRDA